MNLNKSYLDYFYENEKEGYKNILVSTLPFTLLWLSLLSFLQFKNYFFRNGFLHK
jgi:hypothetical protein